MEPECQMSQPLSPPEGPVDPDWHRTFFGGLMNRFWLGAVPEEQTEAERDFLVEALKLQPGARTLDLGCGAGRMTLALAAKGCEAAGVDLSDDFLARAKAATPAGAPVTWLKQDLAALHLSRAHFDGAFMLGNSFAYMTPDETQAMFAATCKALKPGGRLALQTAAAAECVWPHYEPQGDYSAGGVRLRIAHRYDPLTGALYTRFEASGDAGREVRDGVQYIHALPEIAAMMRRAGLDVRRFYAGPDGAAWEPGDPQVFILAARPA